MYLSYQLQRQSILIQIAIPVRNLGTYLSLIGRLIQNITDRQTGSRSINNKMILRISQGLISRQILHPDVELIVSILFIGNACLMMKLGNTPTFSTAKGRQGTAMSLSAAILQHGIVHKIRTEIFLLNGNLRPSSFLVIKLMVRGIVVIAYTKNGGSFIHGKVQGCLSTLCIYQVFHGISGQVLSGDGKLIVSVLIKVNTAFPSGAVSASGNLLEGIPFHLQKPAVLSSRRVCNQNLEGILGEVSLLYRNGSRSIFFKIKLIFHTIVVER